MELKMLKRLYNELNSIVEEYNAYLKSYLDKYPKRISMTYIGSVGTFDNFKAGFSALTESTYNFYNTSKSEALSMLKSIGEKNEEVISKFLYFDGNFEFLRKLKGFAHYEMELENSILISQSCSQINSNKNIVSTKKIKEKYNKINNPIIYSGDESPQVWKMESKNR